MKHFNNKLARHLTQEENKQLADIKRYIEEKFNIPLFSMTITPIKNNETKIYGVYFVLDIKHYKD